MDKDLESGDNITDKSVSNSLPAQTCEDTANNLSLRAVDKVSVAVRKLCVNIDVSPTGLAFFQSSLCSKNDAQPRKTKAILKDVNARMPSGSLTAIIGASGSGKTSILNTLSHRIAKSRQEVSGSITYNESSRLSSIRSAYVMQQDVLLPTLTVRETLRYAAELRLPPLTTPEERRQVVEDVILELGLKECASTRIGNNVHKGCSGGEKRRTSLAVQMLANPSVLFLDEVTTGLDSATAFQLVTTLKSLASKGRTIIMTIHQPRSEIWRLFDHVMLLANGSLLYSGSAPGCLSYFENIGHVMVCKSQSYFFSNNAEILLQTDCRELEAFSFLVELSHVSWPRLWRNHAD